MTFKEDPKQHLQHKKRDTDTPPITSMAWLSLACCQFSPLQLSRLLSVIEHPLELFPDGYPIASPALLRLLKNPGLSGRGSYSNPQTRLHQAEKLVELSLRWAEHSNHHLLSVESPNYPGLLSEIADPPAILFVYGKPAVLKQPQLAIVGSRRSTPAALNLGRRWSAEIAQAGLVITSGMAIGMDAAAHQGCLQAGGQTIAVMASGPDLCYPKQHRALLANIVEQGAAVTELPPGLSPLPRHFPQRNRIISGLALGTLVVEAKQRSGTLVTARHAMEQNREVFAVPGSVLNPEARGCHQLIQQGAKLVQQSSEIMDELPIKLLKPTAATDPAADVPATDHMELNETAEQQAQLQQLLQLAGFDPFNLDSLCSATGMPVKTLMPLVLILELQSRLKSLGDGRYVRC